LRDITWTPVAPLPNALSSTAPDGSREFFYGYFQAWLPEKGVLYSSCRSTEKYIGWNISLETFISALQNPNSVIYTRSLKDQPGTKAHCWYGLVCSMYVSYVLQLPYRAACREFADVPGMELIDSSILEDLCLCDILLSKGHVAIITDILRDVEGNVCRIEVSECKMPLTVATWFSPKEFFGYWLENGYRLYRYDHLDSVTYEPNPWVHVEGDPILAQPEITRALMLDFGNKANYRVGDEPVEISIFEKGWDAVEVTGPDGEKQRYPIEGERLVLTPNVPGFYSARLVKDDAQSGSVEWCMVSIDVVFEKDRYAEGDRIRCRYKNASAEDTVFHLVLNDDSYYVVNGVNIPEEERNSGCAAVPAVTKPGKYLVILLARNAYGIYNSSYIPLIVE